MKTKAKLFTSDTSGHALLIAETEKKAQPALCTSSRLGALNLYMEITMTLFKKILVPTDGSDTSEKAVAMALKMALEQKSQVRLIHAIDELAYASGHEYSGEMANYARQYGAEILTKGMDRMKSMGIDGDTKLIDFAGARLGDTVAEEALSWGADLIVLGTHGRRGIGRFLLGSGAEQVTRLAPIPVLIVRSPEAQKASS